MQGSMFISYHSVVSLNDKLYVTSGFVQTVPEMTDNPVANNKVYTIDFLS